MSTATTDNGVHFPDCLPGCSAYHGQHKYGVSSEQGGGGEADSVGGMRANLNRLADDLGGGDLHCGNFYVWLEEAEADLQKRVEGSSQVEAATLAGQLAQTRQLTLQFRAQLHQAALAIKDFAGKQ